MRAVPTASVTENGCLPGVRGIMRTVAITSPFRCVWIAKGSPTAVDDTSYAICRRIPEIERVVSEEDCRQCPLWESNPEMDAYRPPDRRSGH
jgi:hypothetical protein